MANPFSSAPSYLTNPSYGVNTSGSLNNAASNLAKNPLRSGPTRPSGSSGLRYPASIIESTTDYLKLQHFKYERPGFTRGAPGTNRAYGVKTDATTIILPIPSNIQDGNSVSYSDDSLDGFTAGIYQAITQGETYKKADLSTFGKTLGDVTSEMTTADTATYFSRSLAAQAANIPFGGNLSLGQIVAREEGQIINPNVELLFNGVTLRSFKFSFKMTPRSPGEAKNIVAIIRNLKTAMAPTTGTTEKFLGTPKLFQLTYMKGSSPHPFLHKFKQCFMTDISVNYTGEGVYATYSDGSPISYTMDLGFKEIEPIYAGDYDVEGGVGF